MYRRTPQSGCHCNPVHRNEQEGRKTRNGHWVLIKLRERNVRLPIPFYNIEVRTLESRYDHKNPGIKFKLRDNGRLYADINIERT